MVERYIRIVEAAVRFRLGPHFRKSANPLRAEPRRNLTARAARNSPLEPPPFRAALAESKLFAREAG